MIRRHAKVGLFHHASGSRYRGLSPWDGRHRGVSRLARHLQSIISRSGTRGRRFDPQTSDGISRDDFYNLTAFPSLCPISVLTCFMLYIPQISVSNLPAFTVHLQINIIMATTTTTVQESTSENVGKIAVAFDEKVHEGVSSLT